MVTQGSCKRTADKGAIVDLEQAGLEGHAMEEVATVVATLVLLIRRGAVAQAEHKQKVHFL